MTLYADINTAWKDAMKARDPKKDALASIKADVKKKAIDARVIPEGGAAGEISPPDEMVLEVLAKMAKQRKESIEEYTKADRSDLAEKEVFELGVIESFLPKKLSNDEVTALVRQAIAESGSTSAKDLGKAMKAALAKVNGRADGKDVQNIVKAQLT